MIGAELSVPPSACILCRSSFLPCSLRAAHLVCAITQKDRKRKNLCRPGRPSQMDPIYHGLGPASPAKAHCQASACGRGLDSRMLVVCAVGTHCVEFVCGGCGVRFLLWRQGGLFGHDREFVAWICA